jgi:hypothetical protein
MSNEITLEMFMGLLKSQIIPSAVQTFTEAMEDLRNENPEHWTSMPEEEWIEQFQIYLTPMPEFTVTTTNDAATLQEEGKCLNKCPDCKCK